MQRIYGSHGDVLHVILRRHEFGERVNVSHAHQSLQVACLTAMEGQEFRPHIHKPRNSTITETQECWVVLEGEVCVDYYDVDKTPLGSYWLKAGDVSVTYKGGHGYKILKDAVVVECKNGPYMGSAQLDKEFV